MKVLLVSDLHSQSKCLRYLEKVLKKEHADAIIVSGDITNFGDSQFCDELLSKITKSGLPAYIVWGNADYALAQKKVIASPYNCHLIRRPLGKESVFGIGYGDEPQAINPGDVEGTILVTHQPPVRANLKGNLKNVPKYHISGHLHDAKWVKRVGQTILIQVPTLQNGEYGLFDLASGSAEFKNVL
jgi:Icc-related predicted phosphoesterase